MSSLTRRVHSIEMICEQSIGTSQVVSLRRRGGCCRYRGNAALSLSLATCSALHQTTSLDIVCLSMTVFVL